MPARRSLRKRLDHREMKRESHSSLRMIESRDSPSSSMRTNLARRASAARTVRLRVAARSCSLSMSLRFILLMHHIQSQMGCFFNDAVD